MLDKASHHSVEIVTLDSARNIWYIVLSSDPSDSCLSVLGLLAFLGSLNPLSGFKLSFTLPLGLLSGCSVTAIDGEPVIEGHRAIICHQAGRQDRELYNAQVIHHNLGKSRPCLISCFLAYWRPVVSLAMLSRSVARVAGSVLSRSSVV